MIKRSDLFELMQKCLASGYGFEITENISKGGDDIIKVTYNSKSGKSKFLGLRFAEAEGYIYKNADAETGNDEFYSIDEAFKFIERRSDNHADT